MLLPHRTLTTVAHVIARLASPLLRESALDASGAKVQRNNERIIEIDANSSEYAKKCRKVW